MHSFLERTRAARKIIVVDFGFLGDSVHLTPALWEIKRHYGTAELHTLSAPVGAELLQLAPCVDRPWAFPLTAKSPAWWKHWDILWALRRQKFDLAFNFTGSDRSLFATAFIGARWTLGLEAGRKHFWNGWLSGDWVKRGTRRFMNSAGRSWPRAVFRCNRRASIFACRRKPANGRRRQFPKTRRTFPSMPAAPSKNGPWRIG